MAHSPRHSSVSHPSEWRRECDFADRIVVNSNWSRDGLIAEGVDHAKIRVIPLIYEKPAQAQAGARSYPSAFDTSRPLRALFLGQIIARKGVVPLFDAIRRLEGLPVRFDLVGPLGVDVPEEVRRNPAVHFAGSVPHNATPDFYRDADLFLFPTFSDGFGLTQLEAQAWHLPIIASRHCGDVVRDGIDGIVLPDITGAAIAAVIRNCLANPTMLARMSASIRPGATLADLADAWIDVAR